MFAELERAVRQGGMDRLMRLIASAVCLGMLVIVSGCSGQGGATSLDKDVAKTSLNTFLEAWKRGDKPEDLQKGKPEITVGETEWESGAMLKDYKVQENAYDDGANLHITVELEIQREGDEEPRKRKVTYIVGTSPVITIFPE